MIESTQFATNAMLVLFCMGAGFLGTYFALGRTRSYLLYLGIAFFAFGLSARVTDRVLCGVTLALAGGGVLWAIVDIYYDTRARLAAMKEEQRQREEAFGDFLTAIAQKDSDPPADKG